MDVRRRFSTQSCDDNYGQTAGIQYYKDLSYEVHTSPAMLRSDVALFTTKVAFALVLNCPEIHKQFSLVSFWWLSGF